jgi:hypothetical protein
MTDILQEASAMARMGPPVDIIRLARLRSAMSLGDYPLDPAGVAQALLALDHKIAGRTKPVKKMTPLTLAWPANGAGISLHVHIARD